MIQPPHESVNHVDMESRSVDTSAVAHYDMQSYLWTIRRSLSIYYKYIYFKRRVLKGEALSLFFINIYFKRRVLKGEALSLFYNR